MSWANTNFEGFAGLYDANPALGKHASMKKRIAGPIGEFDEAKPLLGAEPFDHCMDWRAGGCLEAGLAEPGSSSKSAGLRLIFVGVEVATP